MSVKPRYHYFIEVTYSSTHPFRVKAESAEAALARFHEWWEEEGKPPLAEDVEEVDEPTFDPQITESDDPAWQAEGKPMAPGVN
jgi:hypothetical protein